MSVGYQAIAWGGLTVYIFDLCFLMSAGQSSTLFEQLLGKDSHRWKRSHKPVFELEKRSPSGVSFGCAHIIVRDRRNLLRLLRQLTAQQDTKREAHHRSTKALRRLGPVRLIPFKRDLRRQSLWLSGTLCFLPRTLVHNLNIREAESRAWEEWRSKNDDKTCRGDFAPCGDCLVASRVGARDRCGYRSRKFGRHGDGAGSELAWNDVRAYAT
jgi:hypothetical protein